jgi:hypothetical protein
MPSPRASQNIGIEARFPEVPLRGAFIDDQLSASARSALAKFLRVTEENVKALELGQQIEWISRSIDWDFGSPDRGRPAATLRPNSRCRSALASLPFRTAASRDANREIVLVLALLADDSPCAPAKFQRGNRGRLRFKYRSTAGPF